MTTKGVDVVATGPVFDGRAIIAADRMETDITKTVAEQGVTDVQQLLDTVLRNPTGFYRSQIQTERRTNDQYLVTDGQVVYGPWLAGVSSRNKTSAFRGYQHWRRATQRLNRNVKRITQPVVTRRVGQMNG